MPCARCNSCSYELVDDDGAFRVFDRDDPDARGDRELGWKLVVGLGDGRSNALGEDLGVDRVVDRRHDDELIAAKAAEDVVLANHPAQPHAHLLEQIIAGRMPEQVIHRLEAVEVGEDHGNDREVREQRLGDVLLESRRRGRPVTSSCIAARRSDSSRRTRAMAWAAWFGELRPVAPLPRRTRVGGRSNRSSNRSIRPSIESAMRWPPRFQRRDRPDSFLLPGRVGRHPRGTAPRALDRPPA